MTSTFYPKSIGKTLNKYYANDDKKEPPKTIINWIDTIRPSGHVSLERKGTKARRIAYFNSHAQLLMILEIISDYWGKGVLSY